jgi:phosphinothricin acetyltransferase
MSDVQIRRAAARDYPAILGILGYYIENSNASWRYETPGQDWLQGFSASHQRPERPVFVAEIDSQIVGYSCLSDFRSMDGYWPCAENSVYVLPDYQNHQIGIRLMEALLEAATNTRLHKVIAAIDGGNESSIRFHEKFGFEICGQLKDIGFKNGQWLSLVLMVLDLKQSVTRDP